RFIQLRLAEHKHQLVVTENGVYYDDSVSRCEYDWDAFLAYNENDSHSVLWINRWLGICIPNRAFENDDDMIAYKKLAFEKTDGKTLP
ncbi:MAG: YcxB family protein, partial [Pseudomonadota bacterium]